jgi:DNA-binding transcriptional ArsR family regulator
MVQSDSSTNEVDRDRVFRALAAEPRRRLLILLTRGERSVSDLASEFEISRPAVSKHLAVLSETGIVDSRKEGRKNLYRLNHEPLQTALSWFVELDQYWAAHLDDIDEQLGSEE